MFKKNRCPNFSTNEREILIKLITKHKEIIENKKTDAVTTALKNEGWKVITEEFNSLSNFNLRNINQLKTCWDNIKRTSRKDKDLGRGRPKHPPPGSLQGQVEILIGPTQDGLQNEFDNDANYQEEISTVSYTVDKNFQQNLPSITILDPIELCGIDPTELKSSQPAVEESTIHENDCSNYCKAEDKDVFWNRRSPAALKTKISDPLAIKKSWLHRRRPKTLIADKLLPSKLEFIELLKKNAEIQAEKKKLILEEQLKQEKIKTEILQLQLLREKEMNRHI